MNRVTRDSISLREAGVVTISQPLTGHRFTLDSLLLADFCRIRTKDRVLEPGAGVGTISLLLAKKHPSALFYPIEIQENLYALCTENSLANLLENVIPIHHDIRRLSRAIVPGHFDALAVNPPFFKAGAGRSSPDAGRNTARQDVLAQIEFWLDLQKFLKQGGRYFVVFPAARLAEMLSLMRERTLEPKRIRLVHPYEDKPASIALIEAVNKGRTGMEVLPPLIVHGPDGKYTQEMKDLYCVP